MNNLISLLTQTILYLKLKFISWFPLKPLTICVLKMTAAKTCAGCKNEIRARYFLRAVDKYWHRTCLKCSECGDVLEQMGSSCFVKGTSILCRNDYMR